MSFVLTFFDTMAEDEDDELWAVFTKLYGPLLELGLLFPSWRRHRLPLTLTACIFYGFIFPVHIWLLSMSITGVRDDFNMVSMEFHYWLIFSFSCCLIFLMNYNRSRMISIHRKMTIGVGQYRAGRIYTEEYPLQLEKNKRKQLYQFLPLPASILLLAGLVLLIPFMKNMDGTVHYNKRGVNMKLPIAGLYPFPTHEGILWSMAVMGQFMAGGGLGVVIASSDLLLFRMTQSLIFEYKVLQYALDTIMARARKLYKMMHLTEEVEIKDVAFQRCLEKCLKDIVVHHHNINKILKDYAIIIKWPCFLAYGVGTGVIGLSLINILAAKEAGNYEYIALFLGLSMAEVLNMFIISSFGESVTTESKLLRERLYFIEWHELDTINRKLMLNFQVAIKEPVILKVGGVVAVTLDTFSSIINTSYSFFNLVNAQ